MADTPEKEALLGKLLGIQDAEATRPIERMDTDLIAECTDYILELTGETLPADAAAQTMKRRYLRRKEYF